MQDPDVNSQNVVAYLSKRGYVIKKESISSDEIIYLKKNLLARPLQDEKYNTFNKTDPTYPIYTETKNKLYIPKMYGIKRYGNPNKFLPNYVGKKWEGSDLNFSAELNDNQIEPANALLLSCRENGGGILKAATGLGKTVICIKVISELKVKTIIVVNKIPLMRQWESELRRFIPGITIGFIQGQKNVSVEGADVVIAMLQSLARVDYPDSLFDEFSLLTVDECFPYDTHIITSNGNINIGKLYYMKEKGEKLPMVKTFNEITKQFEYKNIKNVFRKQNDTLLEIKCGKMKIRSTENHKYLTYNGWKEAKYLSTNDYIVSNYDNTVGKVNIVCPALNEDQYQIVLGSFLGDGNISLLKSGRYRLRMTHSENQYEYCKWKANIFNVKDIRYIKNNGYSKKPAYHFSTRTFYLFNELPFTKTNVPQWILNDLDERGLAIWFMDDGSIDKKSFNSTISTDSFDEDSQKRIVLKLKSMNIDCKYVNYKKSYYHISINMNGTKQLIKLISKYVHKNMLYKLLPRQYINYIQDTSIKILDETTIFSSRENIKKEFLNENCVYKIYKNYDKNSIYYVKYLNCEKCNKITLHSKISSHTYEYWICRHTEKKNLDMPLTFGEYKWNNNFLDYGYLKITNITKNIKNFKKSSFKRNYVFDLEIEDNHNYIVKNKDFGNIQNGFVVHNCHNTSSRVFSQVLSKLCCKYTIGLSATPKRSDGCEYVFKYHIGDIVYESNSTRNGLPPVLKFIRIDSSEYKEISTVNRISGQKQIQFTSMLSELTMMPKRNKLIIEFIKDLVYKDDRKILVLSDRREHLKEFKRILDEDLSITFTYGLFLGQMKQADLQRSRSSKVILATFSAFGEGVSEKDLDTLILTTPKKFIGHLKTSVKAESGRLEQIVGRIFRKDHDVKNPMIIDFHDNFSVYKNQSAQRKTFYKAHFKNALTVYNQINLDEYEIENIDTSCVKQTKTHCVNEFENTNEMEKANELLKHCVIED